jgi:uncharacterized protein with HEPN domain
MKCPAPPPRATCDRGRGTTAIVNTLDLLRGVLPATKEEWDADLKLRLAVERLWIIAGNAAEEYGRGAGIEAGVEPWAQVVGDRNRLPHALPGDLSTDRIWTDSTSDLNRLLTEVRAATD